MSAGTVLCAVADGIATVTLNRPERRNAIDDGMRAEFVATIADLASNPEVRVMILTGAGSSFCAGGDVAAMKGRLAAPSGRIAIDGWRRQRRTASMIETLHQASPITIAAVNGPAMGLGMDLALACDFIVAAPDAAFASSFIRRGLIPDGGSLYFLPRRIGLQRAKEMMYSGRTVGSEEALRLGLADRVSAHDDAVADAVEYAQQFLQNSSPAIGLMKAIVDRAFETPLADVAQLGGQAQAISYTTDEHRTRVEEFLRR